MKRIETALQEFCEQIEKYTGRKARSSEIAVFCDQVKTCIAHRQMPFVQIGLCDFQTLAGRPELVEVQWLA